MTTTTVNERFTEVQNNLFKHAHTQALELKPLAVEFSKQGLQGEKLYMYPGLIALPFKVCPYLSSLNQRQISLITAAAFANVYEYIASSEDQTLRSNMLVTNKVFDSYSDEYMVLYQETEEEFDHIWSFRAIYQTVCRELGVNSAFDVKSNGFFRGEVGGTYKNFTSQIAYRLLQFAIDDGMKYLPGKLVKQVAFASLWLLYRYVGNVQLKQTETYMFTNPDKFDYDPLARAIVKAHATDEARHYTTSLDMGLDLYRASSPLAQKLVRQTMKFLVSSYIKSYYLTFWEMLELRKQGILLASVKHGIESLTMALNHPEFANHQIDVDDLVDSWLQYQPSNLDIANYPVMKKRWRYTSQQLKRLITALDLQLDAQALGEPYQRYQAAFNFAS